MLILLRICGGGVAGLYTGPPMPCASARLLASDPAISTAIVLTTLFTISPLLPFARLRVCPAQSTLARLGLVARQCLCLRWTYRQTALRHQVDGVLHRDVRDTALLVQPSRRIQLLLHCFAIFVQVG